MQNFDHRQAWCLSALRTPAKHKQRSKKNGRRQEAKKNIGKRRARSNALKEPEEQKFQIVWPCQPPNTDRLVPAAKVPPGPAPANHPQRAQAVRADISQNLVLHGSAYGALPQRRRTLHQRRARAARAGLRTAGGARQARSTTTSPYVYFKGDAFRRSGLHLVRPDRTHLSNSCCCHNFKNAKKYPVPGCFHRCAVGRRRNASAMCICACNRDPA